MPNKAGVGLAAATAAAAAKRAKKKGRLCLKRRQQLERELRKKQTGGAAAGAAVAAAAAGEAADAGSAAATAATRAAKLGAAVAAAETAAAAEALAAASAPSERHAASGRLGKEAQINGTVKPVKPSWDDEEAHREAKLELTVEEAALQEMRERERGWVCALWEEGRLRVYLAGDLEGDKRFSGDDSRARAGRGRIVYGWR